MASMIAGYLAGIALIPKYISQQKALVGCAILGLVFSVTVLVTHGYVSVFFVAFLGLANSLMWPALWPLALNGLGKFTKKGSSLLIMGIAGGSVIPLLYGYLGDVFTLHNAYAILLIIYLFILYYAAVGHKAGGKLTRTMP
ncbi:MAG: hypothetical protein JST32_18235 [Bacteroidetes bacterium]|nr:hypothetical protein [Bacteroidota bacterium]